MTLFSERYKYVKPSEVLLRECFPTDIANGVCSCFDGLEDQLRLDPYQDYGFQYIDLEEYLWVYFLHKRKNDFYVFRGHKIVATAYLLDSKICWYKKLDLIEESIKYLYTKSKSANNPYGLTLVDNFINKVNQFFKRLNYAYKIVNFEVVEITSKEEVVAIETAIKSSKENIKTHLTNALELYAKNRGLYFHVRPQYDRELNSPPSDRARFFVSPVFLKIDHKLKVVDNQFKKSANFRH